MTAAPTFAEVSAAAAYRENIAGNLQGVAANAREANMAKGYADPAALPENELHAVEAFLVLFPVARRDEITSHLWATSGGFTTWTVRKLANAIRHAPRK